MGFLRLEWREDDLKSPQGAEQPARSLGLGEVGCGYLISHEEAYRSITSYPMKRPTGRVGLILMPMYPSVLGGRMLPLSSMIWNKKPVNPPTRDSPTQLFVPLLGYPGDTHKIMGTTHGETVRNWNKTDKLFESANMKAKMRGVCFMRV